MTGAREPGLVPGTQVVRPAFGGRRSLTHVARARLVETRAAVDVDFGERWAPEGALVVVATPDGETLARTVAPVARRLVGSNDVVRFVRVASDADVAAREAAAQLADRAAKAAVRVSRRHRLPVKVVGGHVPLDRSRVIVYVSSEERVDTKRYARDLAAEVGGRLELRTIGVREGAGVIGGLGPCGNDLCCSSFLTSFASISVRFAKDQGLALTPQRITGMCGRLKCCLVYEQATYKEMRGYAPKRRMGVFTPAGAGTILDVDVINRRVLVRTADGMFAGFHVRDVTVLDRPLTPEELTAGGPTKEEAILNARRRRRGGETTGTMTREAATVLSEEYIWEDTEGTFDLGAGASGPAADAASPASPSGDTPAKKKRRRKKKPATAAPGSAAGTQELAPLSAHPDAPDGDDDGDAEGDDGPDDAPGADGAAAVGAPKKKRRRRRRRSGAGGGGAGPGGDVGPASDA
ncbi:MAG: hypothetical protein H6698_04685 [Myxococcales bacterium]|nr:hypothetical protein [Myxococcales bacterium]MCB9530677.1 hypothetical protein [Myxococcales bacterium]MCB9533598.1 hypothetical protein [Myxococcales bacterium]